MAEPTASRPQPANFPARGHSPFPRLLVVLGSIALVVACLITAQKFLIPLAIAILLTFVLSPAVLWLQRAGLGRGPAVGLVLTLALLTLGGIGWVLTDQVRNLVSELAQPDRKAQIAEKLARLQSSGGFLRELADMFRDISQQINEQRDDGGREPDRGPAAGENPPDGPSKVVVVADRQSPFYRYFTQLAGPLLEGLAGAGFVVVVVGFMLAMREDLRSRILRLIGHGRLTSTTKAIDDASLRISNFLMMQSLINACFGLLFSAGLFFLGVPYALLWGFINALLRFVPYLGTWGGLALPLLYDIAISPDLTHPLMLFAVWGVLEMTAVNFVEPFWLGHSTGVSPVALLVAAGFWAWVWGPIGLILATPLTSCLVVLGKYIPDMDFLDILLGHDPLIETDITYYQRLLAHDQDEAAELVEEFLKNHQYESVFDEVLLPALTYAKADHDRGELGHDDLEFILRSIRVLAENYAPPILTNPDSESCKTKVVLLGCPARDEAEEVGLLLLQNLLATCRCTLEVCSTDVLPAEVAARVTAEAIPLVCVGSLPPGGLAQTRYLLKKLRTQAPGLKIVVCRWGQKENVDRVKERLTAAGADMVAVSFAESRDLILSMLPVLTSQQEEKNATRAAGDEPARSGRDLAAAGTTH